MPYCSDDNLVDYYHCDQMVTVTMVPRRTSYNDIGHAFSNELYSVPTANLRGYMEKCDLHLCDDLTAALKPNNIEFLRITTTSIVHYLALEFDCSNCEGNIFLDILGAHYNQLVTDFKYV